MRRTYSKYTNLTDESVIQVLERERERKRYSLFSLSFRVEMKSLWIYPTISISRKICLFLYACNLSLWSRVSYKRMNARRAFFAYYMARFFSLDFLSGFRGNSSWERSPLSPLPSPHPSSLSLRLPRILPAFFVHVSALSLSDAKPLFAEARKNDFVFSRILFNI